MIELTSGDLEGHIRNRGWDYSLDDTIVRMEKTKPRSQMLVLAGKHPQGFYFAYYKKSTDEDSNVDQGCYVPEDKSDPKLNNDVEIVRIFYAYILPKMLKF